MDHISYTAHVLLLIGTAKDRGLVAPISG